MQHDGHGSRAAKVVVGLLGGLYLLGGLGLAAYAGLLVLGFDHHTGIVAPKTVLFAGAGVAIWVLLTGITAIVVAFEADEPFTAWTGGLGMLSIGLVVAGAFAVWFFSRP